MGRIGKSIKNVNLPTIAASVVFSLLAVLSIQLTLAHGGDGSRIHSCVSSVGSLRIVGTTEDCISGETALDWSQNANNGLPLICGECTFSSIGSRFAGKDLSDSYLELANFSGSADLSDSNFTGTVFKYADFTGTDLSNSNLTNADLTGAAGMDSATLTGVTWNNTICPDATNSDNNSNTCIGHLTP